MNNHRMLKMFAGLVLLCLSTVVFGQKIVGYLPDYRKSAIPNLQYDKVTDIIYSFVQFDASGNFPTGTTGTASDADFQTLKTKCQQNKVKLLIASGGYNYTMTANFATVAASPTLRTTLITNICNYIKNNNLDGFDFDWEYPKTTDSTNFYNLIKELKTAMNTLETQMGKELTLSLACGAGADQVTGLPKRGWNYLDYVGIMAYDMQPFSTLATVTNSWDLYTKTLKVPASKILMGLPFYTAGGANTYDGYASSVGYANAYNGTSPASGSDGTTYNSYPTIKAKVDYVMPKGAAGVMIWELGQDALAPANYQYSLLSATYLSIKPYAAPPCAKPNLGADQSVCGQTAAITLNTGLTTKSYRTFTWYKDNQVISGATSPTYQLVAGSAAAGKYWVKVDSSGKCSNVDTINISATIPNVNLGADITLCTQTSAILDAKVTGTGITYAWKKDNVAIANATSKTYTATQAGTYTVTVSASGCTAKTDNIVISSNLLTITGTTDVCTGSSTTLTVSNTGGPFSWYDAAQNGNVVKSNSSTFTVTPTTQTTYYVQDGAGTSGVIGTTGQFGTQVWEDPTNKFMTIDTKVPNVQIKSVDMYVGTWGALTNLVFAVKNAAGTDIGTSQAITLTNQTATIAKLTIPINITIPSAATGYKLYIKSITTPSTYLQAQNNQITEATNSLVIAAGTQLWNNIQFVAGSACARTPVTVTTKSCTSTTPTLTFSNTNTGAINSKITLSASSESSGAITYTVTNGTGTATISGNQLTLTKAGTVTVKATQAAAGNYTSATATQVITITTINGLSDEELHLEIYPNPTSNLLHVTMPNLEEISITTIKGENKLSQKTTIDQTTIDLSQLEDGTYIINLRTATEYISRKITILK